MSPHRTLLSAAAVAALLLSGCASSPVGAWKGEVTQSGVRATYHLVIDENEVATLLYQEAPVHGGGEVRSEAFVGAWSQGDVDALMDLSCAETGAACAPFGRPDVLIACELSDGDHLTCSVQGSRDTFELERDDAPAQPAQPTERVRDGEDSDHHS